MQKQTKIAKGGEIYQEIWDKEKTVLSKPINEQHEDNVIRIADKEFIFYNEAILNKLQVNDQIIIECIETYIYRAEYIIRKWEALGILPDTTSHRIIWQKRKDNIKNRDGQFYEGTINSITLTKMEELFKFTKN